MDLWREKLRNNFTNWQKLADFLQLSIDQREKIWKNPRFALNVPYRIAQKMQKGTLDDPLLKQFLPLLEESLETEGFCLDPTEDNSFRSSGKLLQKYQGRSLIITTSACAMHCRFCFRQNFPYETERKSFEEELKRIDSSIKEIILSGGDPLSLSNDVLKELIGNLSAFENIKRIRFHSRFPIGIPERIDREFIKIIQDCPKQVFFVLHCNHAKELDDEILEKMSCLQKAGAVLLNQAVLLKDINDSLHDLQELAEKLVDHGIGFYYLHQLDRVLGTKHFEVNEKTGLQLVQQLTGKLSGYAVPKYVKEIPQKASKTNLLTLRKK